MLPGAISVVVVSYNTRGLLRRCLLSVVENPHHRIVSVEAETRGYGATETRDPSPFTHDSSLVTHHPPVCPIPCEITVVDNASSDGSADMVAADFPQVQLVRAAENLGFARATNEGLRRSSGEWLLLLNPDTEVVGDALPQMVEFLSVHPSAAAVGPSLIYPDGRPQDAAFRFPTLWMTFLDLFPLHHRLLSSPLNGRYRPPLEGQPFPVDHPLGAAMMIRRESLDEVGLLDEAFFMYCEEVDWSIRAGRLGWSIFHLPSAMVVHHSGQSTSQVKEEMLVELWRSRYRLYSKHYSKGFLRAHRIILRAGLARSMAMARWDAYRGRISHAQLERRLAAYRNIWEM
jgi:N-acetylglucosaminyl-diphospho-decaprenol L-rhamnosyltransferase